MVKLEAACFLTSVLVPVAIVYLCLSAVRVSSVPSSPVSGCWHNRPQHWWIVMLMGKLFLFNLNLFLLSSSLMSQMLSPQFRDYCAICLRWEWLALQKALERCNLEAAFFEGSFLKVLFDRMGRRILDQAISFKSINFLLFIYHSPWVLFTSSSSFYCFFSTRWLFHKAWLPTIGGFLMHSLC